MMCDDAPSSSMSAMSIHNDDDNSISVCANCGKEGSDVTNTCNKCKGVMYCNAACKKKHRHKHKKDCERRVAELHDEKLFKQPPQKEDCPICFLRMPSLTSVQVYMACCGKEICNGCIHAADERDEKGDGLCPFCRTPAPDTDEEVLKRYKIRMEKNDSKAIYDFGGFYAYGYHGLPQNMAKALKLWYRAGELGNINAYHNIGIAYENGRGVEINKEKAVHYYELAAMGGNVTARHNLGFGEYQAGNMDRALKHWMIAIEEGGFKMSFESVKQSYSDGHATKIDYTKALRANQAYLDEIKSDQRDEAAASNVRYTYY